MIVFRELQHGVSLTDENNKPLEAQSKKAAFQGISAVVLSRIGMALPGMGKHKPNTHISYFVEHLSYSYVLCSRYTSDCSSFD